VRFFFIYIFIVGFIAKSDTSVITNDCLPVYEAPNETNLNNQGNNYLLVLEQYLLKYVLVI